ncbi:MAG: cytidylate kinase-like family protein [Eubacteriales bacterium]|nr:cytidylate kinase-like family protein [Eubacteriales bacterium]
MKKIVTISREFGAGGGSIGSELAAETGFEYFDKELILMMAGKGDVDIYSILKWDEHVPIHFGFTQSLFDFYSRPLSERVFEAQRDIIKKIGEKGSCVIVGRNANTILREYDHSLHVFVHADFDWRLENMKKRMPGRTEQEIADEIRKVDKKRTKYCSYHTSTKFGDSRYYDLCLDSSRLEIQTCVKLIREAMED